MGKKIDTSLMTESKKHKNRKVRIAYTLNNTQPVMCTMVSDQPFFYIDEEIQGDDDYLFADEFSDEMDSALGDVCADDPTLIKELLLMKNKIDAYEKMSTPNNEIDSRDDVLASFKTQGEETFSVSQADTSTSVNEIISLIEQSNSAKFYLEFAAQNNLQIEQSTQTEKIYLDVPAQKLLVSTNLTLCDGVILLTRELRRFWKTKNNAMMNPLDFHPDHAVLINRAQNADLDGAVIRVGWELRLANEYDVWNRIENSFYADLARAFAREALSNFRTLNNGKAQAVLFETWFLSNRCSAADKKLINMMLSEYKDYVQNNETQATPFDILCRLGEQPLGKNYLSSYANMIVEDTLFTEVRDRSNANFLWFIKFERDFGEAEKIAEQQLQSSDISKTSGDSDLMNNKYIEDSFNEKIHAFPARSANNATNRAKSGRISEDNAITGGNNVIFADFGTCGSSYGQS